MTNATDDNPNPASGAHDFEESGEEAHERRDRWGDHDASGASTPGSPADAAENVEADEERSAG